jgi:hypothetical protein
MATMATAQPSPGGPSALLSVAAAIAVVVGAFASLLLMRRTGSRAPWFLLAAFLVWVGSPFVALAWAMITSSRWQAVPPVMVNVLALAVAAGSLATYTGRIAPPRHAPNAFIYIVVPGVSWGVMILVWTAAFLTRRSDSR